MAQGRWERGCYVLCGCLLRCSRERDVTSIIVQPSLDLLHFGIGEANAAKLHVGRFLDIMTTREHTRHEQMRRAVGVVCVCWCVCVPVRGKSLGRSAVSYTHLTLPTKA